MHPLVRHAVVLLVMLAQLSLGSSAGGVVCFGSCFGGHDAASEAANTCSHAHESDPHAPIPVQPHEDDDRGCPCLDVSVPFARPSQWASAGDALQQTALLLQPWVLQPVVAESLARAYGVTWSRPPGPAPGFRTTRLLI